MDFVSREPFAAPSQPPRSPHAPAVWRYRTFERGVEAETLACGSGAIAVAAVLAREGVCSPIVLRPASGIDLEVRFEGGAEAPRAFHLTGEARIVFEGVIASDPPRDDARRDDPRHEDEPNAPAHGGATAS